jgi:transcriptional regulator with XRE-family HTH domain
MEVLIDGCRYLPAFKLDRKRTKCTLGNALSAYRIAAGLSLSEAASRAQISKTYLWEIEAGKAEAPSFAIVARLAKVYGVDLNMLAE